jgi:hypothetical protein
VSLNRLHRIYSGEFGSGAAFDLSHRCRVRIDIGLSSVAFHDIVRDGECIRLDDLYSFGHMESNQSSFRIEADTRTYVGQNGGWRAIGAGYGSQTTGRRVRHGPLRITADVPSDLNEGLIFFSRGVSIEGQRGS